MRFACKLTLRTDIGVVGRGPPLAVRFRVRGRTKGAARHAAPFVSIPPRVPCRQSISLLTRARVAPVVVQSGRPPTTCWMAGVEPGA